jgi:hypothetical protein
MSLQPDGDGTPAHTGMSPSGDNEGTLHSGFPHKAEEFSGSLSTGDDLPSMFCREKSRIPTQGNNRKIHQLSYEDPIMPEKRLLILPKGIRIPAGMFLVLLITTCFVFVAMCTDSGSAGAIPEPATIAATPRLTPPAEVTGTQTTMSTRAASPTPQQTGPLVKGNGAGNPVQMQEMVTLLSEQGYDMSAIQAAIDRGDSSGANTLIEQFMAEHGKELLPSGNFGGNQTQDNTERKKTAPPPA